MEIVGIGYCSRLATQVSDGDSPKVARVNACGQSRLALLIVLTTHPIQYQVPLWQALAADGRVPFEVWFMTDHGVRESLDREFGRAFAWDLNLLSGYPSRSLEVAPGASPSSFWKCRLRERLRTRLVSSGASALWIQGWQVAAYWQAVWEARAAGVPIWLRGESNCLAPTQGWKRPMKRLLLGWLFRQVAQFLYIGSANRDLYRTCGVPESKLQSTPYAVDNDRFARHASDLRPQRADLRRRWAIPEGAFCVLFCGKFIPKKRPMDLVEAARRWNADRSLPKIHLLFVGSGELDANLRSACFEATGSGISPEAASQELPPATFAGFLNQTEVAQAYCAADCLALPSDHGETWGLVANEAMASGLPCVVSNKCGCAQDLLRDLDSRLRFQCGNIEELLAALKSVLHHCPAPSELAAAIDRHHIRVTIETVVGLFALNEASRAS